MNIGAFSFFHTVFQPGTGTLGAGTYTFSFTTTTTQPTALSRNLASNMSSPLALFAQVIIAPNTNAGSIFTVTGSTPFLYNPGAGNLLLDVQYSSTDAPSRAFFDVDLSGSGVVGRAYGDSPNGSDHNGLVTQFDAAVVSAPEPGSLTLVASGLAGLFGVARRRKQSRVR
jgi:hypothetical protein